MEKPSSAQDVASAFLDERGVKINPMSSEEESLLAKHIARDRKIVANHYRSVIVKLYAMIGARKDSCKSCGRDVWWVTMRSGKANPFTIDGLSHFSDCPKANEHRKR